MIINRDYDAALSVFEEAIKAFCRGDSQTGDKLLRSLDRHAIERDRLQLRQLARQAKPFPGERLGPVGRRTIPPSVQIAVSVRDAYQCRFTGRRLIETDVFKEVARISNEFHFDEHHSVRQTKRGPGGHPIVRTHGAAFEHAGTPHSHGGDTSVDNLALISVELNEGKSNLVLPILPASRIKWTGLSEYLPLLRKLPSVTKTVSNAAQSAGSTPIRIRMPRTNSGSQAQSADKSMTSGISLGTADTSPQEPTDAAAHVTENLSGQQFQAAFKRFWAFLTEERANRREVIYSSYGGNPRRITRIAGDVIYLVETTKRAGASSCTRIELRNDFAQLVNDPNWRNSSLQQVRAKHGIKNLVEFKRDMFDHFERDFLRSRTV
jgi:hypothetical protein